jgi:hypothetical protein
LLRGDAVCAVPADPIMLRGDAVRAVAALHEHTRHLFSLQRYIISSWVDQRYEFSGNEKKFLSKRQNHHGLLCGSINDRHSVCGLLLSAALTFVCVVGGCLLGLVDGC